MKKFITLLFIALLLGMVSSKAATTTILVNAGSCTNLLGFAARVTQVLVSAPTVTNTSVLLIDAPTNVLTFVQPAFTNVLTYATNVVNSYTNYFGVPTLITNYGALVDMPNAVAASTNLYPQRLSLAALAGTTITADNVNYYFGTGVTVTNNSTGSANVTITYFGN